MEPQLGQSLCCSHATSTVCPSDCVSSQRITGSVTCFQPMADAGTFEKHDLEVDSTPGSGLYHCRPHDPSNDPTSTTNFGALKVFGDLPLSDVSPHPPELRLDKDTNHMQGPTISMPVIELSPASTMPVATHLSSAVLSLPLASVVEPFAAHISSFAPSLSGPSLGTDTVRNMSWSSLFNNKPRNAGSYVPNKFEINCVDGVMIPPDEVIEAGPEDRQRVLESDPIVIDGRPFIVTAWTPSVDSARDQEEIGNTVI